MELLDLLKAFILGMVEGLTEFIPVSSTGHMILVDDLWLQSGKILGSPDVANTFKVVVQLGSILATLFIFKDRFLELLGLKRRTFRIGNVPAERLRLGHILIGLLPAGILGVLFEDVIDEHLFKTIPVLLALVAGALLMIIADRAGKDRLNPSSLDEITYRQALIIGLFQCLSLWPGFSRSGATISGGVILGLSHRAAADFTFIMAVPIMAGASCLSLFKNWAYFSADVLPFFAVGFISAFIFAWLSIRFFLKLIDRVKLVPFALYRIALASVLYFLLYF
jgi:Undecaprenyl-diphosphatase (EC 3.6.1.27)